MEKQLLIKCGRETYEIRDGETIMDNGACLQLITRGLRKGWSSCAPRVSKKAFASFKKIPGVEILTAHCYGKGVTLWRYSI